MNHDSSSTPEDKPISGAQLFVECLKGQGVRQIWGYPGGAIMPVYDALVGSGIKHYLTRHEQGAIFAAQGYARSTGKTGVCLATSGPGATNLVTGIADAYMDSVPLVVITGQVPLPLIGTDAFQEVDIYGVTLPIVKHSFLVENVDEIPSVIEKAFHLAGSGRPGPVLIDLPKDVTIAMTTCKTSAITNQWTNPPKDSGTLARNERAFGEFQKLLERSSRPVVFCGGGIAKSGAIEELGNLVESSGYPVVTSLHGVGAVDGDHPMALGMLGMHGLKAANMAVQNCDLLIAIGVRFDDRATGKLNEFAPEARVVHMDIDPAEFDKLRFANVSIEGDLNDSLKRASRLEFPPRQSWVDRCKDFKQEHQWDYSQPCHGIHAPKLLRDLSVKAEPDTVVCCDVGQHQMWVAQHFRFTNPRAHLTSGGLGTMGFGLPAAIGAQIANPDRTVINVCGDGSIMMNVQELATIKRYQLPVKILLLDNSVLGMVRQWQELFFDGRESEIDLSDNPDFSQVARSFGIDAQTYDDPADHESIIDALLNKEGPFLAHVKIERAANVWPLVPPGKNNLQMIES